MEPFNEQNARPPAMTAEGAANKELEIKDGDDALKFLQTEAQDGEAEHVDDKKLVRKIDWIIVPLMFLCYLLQFLDKSLLNYAAVMGIRKDAHLSTEQFGNLAWLFYLGFLIFEMPHAYFMQRLPTAKYLGAMITCWGIIIACTSACDSYASLAALRFILGCFESAISPAFILITSMWYQRHEQPKRVGFWYIGAGTAQVLGGLISFGFQHYHGHRFRSWQIMFLVIGLITVVVGLVVAAVMPDNPMSARRLTHPERVAAVERLRENQTGIQNKHFKCYQFVEALTDPQNWLFCVITIAMSIPNGAIGSFQSIVISSYGYSNEQTALLQMPGGAIEVVTVLLSTHTAARFNARCLNIMVWSAIGGVLGGSLLAFVPAHHRAGRLAGNYLTHVVGASLPCTYALATANAAGTTKRVTTNALLLMSFCLGNILGPLTFRNKDAPQYTPAKVTIVVVDLVVIAATAVLWCYYWWRNRTRRAQTNGLEPGKDTEWADLTDRQNLWFRYKY